MVDYVEMKDTHFYYTITLSDRYEALPGTTAVG